MALGDDTFRTTTKILKLYGCWMDEPMMSVWYRIKLFLFYMSASPVFIGIYVHLYQVVKDGDEEDISMNLLGITEGIFVLYSALVCLYKFNDIISYVNYLKHDYEFGASTSINTLIKKQNKYAIIINIAGYSSIFILSIVTYFSTTSCLKNSPKSKNYTCGLLSPFALPWNFDIDKYRLAILLLQLYCVLLVGPLLLNLTYFGVSLIEHITIKIHHLREILESKTITNSDLMEKDKFVYCIRYHNHILNLNTELHACVSKLNDVHFALSSVVFGIVCYRIILNYSYLNIIQFASWFLAFACLSSAGQELLDECQQLEETLYFMNWPDMHLKLWFYVKMMLLKSQNPLKYSAGIFYAHSHVLLLMICRGAYTYMTVLKKINK